MISETDILNRLLLTFKTPNIFSMLTFYSDSILCCASEQLSSNNAIFSKVSSQCFRFC